jgi:hypothetical protein
MSQTEEHWGEKPVVMVAQDAKSGFLAVILRSFASFWMYSLMLVAAGLAGAAFITMMVQQRQLLQEQEKTEAEVWAVVTYRDALQDAVDNMSTAVDDMSTGASGPTPPGRPQWQIKLDQLRVRNAELREQIKNKAKVASAPPPAQPTQSGWPGLQTGKQKQ